MPVYEYVCAECHHEFEALSRSVARVRTPSCPKCNSKAVERKLSVFAAREGMGGASPTPSGGSCDSCCDLGGPCSLP